MTHHIPRLSIGPLNRIRRRLHHSIILGLTALTTATATTLCSTSAIPTAHADALPNFPTNPIAKARWVNPNLRLGEEASNYKIEILRVPQHIKLGEELKVTLKVVNNSPESIAGFKIVPAHADAPKDLATARIVLSQEPGAYPYQAKTISRDDIIAPGHSVDIDVIIPTAPGATGGFNISEADFYPVLFALRSLENDALLYTQRFLLNVNAKNTTGSGATTGATHQGNSGTNTGSQTADTNSKTSSQLSPGVTIVYPLTATVDSVGGETGEAPNHPPLILESEQLAEQLRSGGRLDTLLKDYSTYTKASESLATATCLAIDPQLVSVVERMAGGYTIAHDRPSTVSQKRRLRDSWGTDDEPESGTPGTGADDAGRWLAELRKTAQHAKCTIALPWGNTDLNSVAATGNDWLMREAVQTGPGIIATILGITPETNIVIPGAGYVTTQAAGNLGWADLAPYRSRNEYPNISDEWQKDSKQVGAPVPTAPVDVLVADNTVWGIPKVDRFGVLDTAGATKNATTNSNIGGGIRAVTYLGSLAASLAEATDTATTVGYSNYNARFNYDLDSLPARRATATSALQMSIMKANNEGNMSDSRGGGQGDSPVSGASSPQPLLVQLPSAMSNTAQWLDALVKMFESNAATPMKLSDYVNPSLQQVEQLASMAAATSAATSAAADAATEADEQQRLTQSAQAVQSGRSARLAGSVRPASSVDSQRTQRAPAPTTAATGTANVATAAEQSQPNSTPFGAPHEDPGVISDSEIFRATSLLESIDNLTQLVISDPTIALTPYGFTEPLRQDILRALSRDRRRAMSTYDTNVRDVQRLLDNEDIVLKELRSSVALIPPGNVYTRISESSPLLIVARNGLPLPVDTRIHYWGPTGAKINMPETIFIPAKGSITVQMTASLPTDTAWDERTDLNLWLATNSGSRFSDEITIGVRTRSGVLGTSGSLASLAVIVLSIALLGRLTLRRRKAKSEAAADSKSTVSTNSD
ncbi:hypothetical protein [Corynebacterium matruchotii]|uniref:hypothetical protein n=1 Tax=Corynebacterium matruchotii TaxID=43768 RepID=UPI0028806B99|nr:hypothetical protein [Corynebacterium matruchotii]